MTLNIARGVNQIASIEVLPAFQPTAAGRCQNRLSQVQLLVSVGHLFVASPDIHTLPSAVSLEDEYKNTRPPADYKNTSSKYVWNMHTRIQDLHFAADNCAS